MVLFFVRDIHLVLMVVWYPLLKASFVLKGFQGWILACTLIFVFYSLIHQLYPRDQRKQYTIFQRGTQPVSEASKANTCVPWWYCQTFPKILAGLRGECLSSQISLKFNWKPTAGSEARLSFPPYVPVFHLAAALVSLLLNSPLWISFSGRSRNQPYPNLSFSG